EEEQKVEGGLYPPVRDGAKVVSVLRRAAKVARQAKAQYGATGRVRNAAYVGAFAEVLDASMRLWDAGVPELGAEQIQALIDAVQSDLAAGVQPDPASLRRWQSSLAHAADMAQQPAGKGRYGTLKLPPAGSAAAAGGAASSPSL
ncbi:hypothetical protein Agub_g345, partial [Astrephomene gubernaculifera]